MLRTRLSREAAKTMSRKSKSASARSNRPQKAIFVTDENRELTKSVAIARTSIGAEVRSIRRRLNLTQREFATKVGLSIGMISKIEHGNVTASVEVLIAIAQSAGVAFAKLFSGIQESRSCHYIPAGNGLLVAREGSDQNFAHYLMGNWFTELGLCELYLVTAMQDANPFFSRQTGSIFLHMLTGKINYRHGNAVFPLAPGDTLYFDAASLNGPDGIEEYPVSYLIWRQAPTPRSDARNRKRTGRLA